VTYPLQRSDRGHISTLPILSINFIGALGFSIVLPFMVFLVTRWGGNALVFGAIGASYSFFQLIGAPILGRWSDRYGRRRVLLLSQLGTMFSWVLFLVAFALPVRVLLDTDSPVLGQLTLTLPLVLLFAARSLDGLTGGNVSVANAYLADISSDEDRSANFGRMAVSSNIGFVAGPALAGLLGATVYGELLPVAAALVISIGASALIAIGLREIPQSTTTAVGEDSEDQNHLGRDNACAVFGQEARSPEAEKSDWRAVLEISRIPTLLTINFLVMLGFSFFYIAFPIHAAGELEWSVSETGVFFAVLSLVMVVVQGPVLAAVSTRIGESTLMSIGTILLASAFALFWFPDTAVVYLAAVTLAMGNGLLWPTFMAVLAKRADGPAQGGVQGLAGSVGAAASIIGLLAGGVLYTSFGEWVFILAAVVIGSVLVFAHRGQVCSPADGEVKPAL
jgi:DHA1 family tetracycline resistance protein-like MFS transporter